MTADTETIADVIVAAVKAATAPLVARVAALEASAADELDAEAVAAALGDLLRKELAMEPVRMQKRVIRDAQGQIARVVEEPIT